MARELYAGIANLPIISPHGHVDPALLADENATFGSPADTGYMLIERAEAMEMAFDMAGGLARRAYRL